MAVAFAAAFLLAACGGGGSTALPTETPLPTAIPTALGSPTPGAGGPFYPADYRTGIATIDRIIVAVLAGDAASLSKLVDYSEVACVAKPGGVGAPPQCLSTEVEGTRVVVLPAVLCEGLYLRPSEVEEAFRRAIAPPKHLYAVFRPIPSDSPPGAPPAEYAIVFGTALDSLQSPKWLISADGKIVAVHLGCGYPQNTIPAGREVVVPPK